MKAFVSLFLLACFTCIFVVGYANDEEHRKAASAKPAEHIRDFDYRMVHYPVRSYTAKEIADANDEWAAKWDADKAEEAAAQAEIDAAHAAGFSNLNDYWFAMKMKAYDDAAAADEKAERQAAEKSAKFLDDTARNMGYLK
jgi:hypothetical protein